MYRIKMLTGMWDCTVRDKRLAVVGSRTIDNIDLVFDFLDELTYVDKIISGGAKGVDTLAEMYAISHDIPHQIIRPEWNKYGKRAGFLRNTLIVEECTHLIAFWDGVSKGTMHSVNKARDMNKSWNIYTIKTKFLLNNTGMVPTVPPNFTDSW